MRLTLARGVLAAASILALPACGSKKEPPPAPGSASAAAPAATPAPAPTPAPPPKPPAPEAAPPAPSAGGALPAECNEYRETIQRLAKCGDALPQSTRDNLQGHFEQQWAGWEKLPEPEKRALAAICKSSSDSVKAAAAAGCGW
jgi:hypothetical protein